MRTLSTGFLALAAISLLTVGCGSDSKPGTTTGTGGSASGTGGSASGTGGSASGTGGSASGTGGSASGTGGSASGTGGSASGTGGSASGTGGSTGTGGMVGTDAGTDAPASCIAPTAASGLVSDFAGATAAATLQTGGTDTWAAYPTTGMPMVAVAAGEMHAQDTGPWASLSVSVAGFGTCVNLSKYTGVKFKIKSATNTSLIFQVATRETQAESNHYRAMVTVAAAYTDITIPFTSLMAAPFGVNPPAGFKPHERAYAIAFGVLAMTEKLDIFLDDVTFY
ncbi:MAG TPA: hypothetical protein VFH73_16725 [Polyangia bacterium]|nr:hypothetical protein [Polyangia bacterium]